MGSIPTPIIEQKVTGIFMKEIWVVTGQTESCDDIGPHVFEKEPTEDDLRDLAEWEHNDECLNQDNKGNCDCGPGDFGSYSHFEVKQVKQK